MAAGGKRIVSDRVEWITIADPATAAAALQNGEVDWLELPLPDRVPTLRQNRNVAVDIQDPLGNIGTLFFNHLSPPFNDVRARRAILMAINQADYMRAYVGDDKMLKPLPGFFTPGTPLYTEEGGEILKGARNLDAAKRLLAESNCAGEPVISCAGEPVISMAAQDLANHKAWGDLTADLLTRLGVKVRYAVDWGTVVARRAQKSPAAGTFSTRVSMVSTVWTSPTSFFAPMATKRSSDDRTSPKSKPRSQPGTMPRRSMKRSLSRAG